MNANIVTSYITLIKSIPDLIEISGYRNDYIARKLGLKPQSFSAKKQRSSWSPEEVEKLLYIIKNSDVEDFLDAQLHKANMEGEFISSEEFEKKMGW